MQHYDNNLVLTYAFYDNGLRGEMAKYLPKERLEVFGNSDIMEQLEEYACVADHLYRLELLQLFGLLKAEDEHDERTWERISSPDMMQSLTERVDSVIEELNALHLHLTFKVEMMSFDHLFWFHEWVRNHMNKEQQQQAEKLESILMRI